MMGPVGKTSPQKSMQRSTGSQNKNSLSLAGWNPLNFTAFTIADKDSVSI